MKLFAIFALFMTQTLAQAGNLYLSFGPSLDGAIAEKKALSVGYEATHGTPSLILEAGAVNGPDLLGYGGVNLGVHVVTIDGSTARIGFGPSVFSGTNDRLSSLFEFHIQARLGLDFKGWEAGLQFDHFSNAGLVPPNPGMDLAAFYVGFPL